jgi:uncharacterized protein YaiI (UPF0178 family)
MMKLYVDADACPKVIKDIVCRAAERAKVMTIFVANTRLDLPVSPYITMKKVSAGFDVADFEIVRLMQACDLVITADIPLAYEVVKKGGFALNPRGQLYTSETITQALATRDLMTNLRDAGLVSSGASPLSKTDRQTFANHLDRIITQNV